MKFSLIINPVNIPLDRNTPDSWDFDNIHFFTGLCTIFDHNTVQFPDIHETWNGIFAACDRIEIAVGDLILRDRFIAYLIEERQ